MRCRVSQYQEGNLMDKNQQTTPLLPLDPLKPVMEVLQGDSLEAVCARHNLTRAELGKRVRDHQASLRQMALTDHLSLKKINRNEPCPCGSGKKYKKCCLPKHEEARKNIPMDALQEMEDLARRREQQEKDVQKGLELLFSQDLAKAGQLALRLLESYPEDDRVHDILVARDLATGNYEEAFNRSRRRWQVAQEEKTFYQENGYHKREGQDRKNIAHFLSPSTWLERFWISQRARAYEGMFPAADDRELLEAASKLRIANDTKRFPGRGEEGYEMRRKALAPTLAQLEAAGPKAIPFLLPLTYYFSWASLFVPEILFAYGTDISLKLIAELSMFRTPYFAQKCLSYLEQTGPRAVAQIAQVLQENPAFDELKTGLIQVLGNIDTAESFALLAKLTEHEDPYVVAWAAQALERHQNPEALPYLEKAKQRLDAQSKIAGAMRELANSQ
jgi:hypothetical protein